MYGALGFIQKLYRKFLHKPYVLDMQYSISSREKEAREIGKEIGISSNTYTAFGKYVNISI